MGDDLDKLFRLHSDELRALAYRRLGDREAAADVTQDAFLRYTMALRQGRPAPDSPRFFLWRILFNLILDFRRSLRRRGSHMPVDELAEQLADNKPLQDSILEHRQQLARLRQALQSLPPNCRRALLLNRLHGLTHAQIAVQLQVSPSMVSKYIMQALLVCARRLPPTLRPNSHPAEKNAVEASRSGVYPGES